jgi:hypothetical protein
MSTRCWPRQCRRRRIEAMTESRGRNRGPHKQDEPAADSIPRATRRPGPPDVVTRGVLCSRAEHAGESRAMCRASAGCQQGGHKGNHDCFVRSRAAKGDVIEWEGNGVEVRGVHRRRDPLAAVCWRQAPPCRRSAQLSNAEFVPERPDDDSDTQTAGGSQPLIRRG